MEEQNNMGEQQPDETVEQVSLDPSPAGQVSDAPPQPMGAKQKMVAVILFAIAALAVVALLGFIFLSNQSHGVPDESGQPIGNASGTATDRDHLIQNEKYLSGTVKSISFDENSGTGVLVVQASVLDVDGAPDFIEVSERQFITKEFSLVLTRDSIFNSKTVAEIQPSDVVQVDTNESIYLSSNLVATRVTSYDKKEEIKKQTMGDAHNVYGTVKTVTDSEIVVTTELLDLVAFDALDVSGSYSLPYTSKDIIVVLTDKTEILREDEGVPLQVVVGDMVSVFVTEDVYETDMVTAEQIIVFAAVDESSL